MRNHPRQLELQAIVDAPARPLPGTWGGSREGAGRPKKAAKDRTFVPHHPRPTHKKRHPTHVTLHRQRLARSLSRARAQTSSEVRRALVYVLQNERKHGFELLGPFIDPLSTATCFLGWTIPTLPDPDPCHRERSQLCGRGNDWR